MDNNSLYTDKGLFDLIARGDASAFAQLYRRHWKHCFQTAFRILGREDLAEDVVQDLFVKLWQKRETLAVNHPPTYLKKAVHNRALNSLRHLRADDRFYLRLAAITSELLEENPHFLSENEQLLQLVIRSLPEDCRETFLLSRVHQFTYKEIADRLKVSEKTIEKRMHRVLQHIRHSFYQYMLAIWVSQGFF